VTDLPFLALSKSWSQMTCRYAASVTNDTVNCGAVVRVPIVSKSKPFRMPGGLSIPAGARAHGTPPTA